MMKFESSVARAVNGQVGMFGKSDVHTVLGALLVDDAHLQTIGAPEIGYNGQYGFKARLSGRQDLWEASNPVNGRNDNPFGF